MKIVNKPWGKEVWLELNEKYCYKRIYINAGTRTSYQYHQQKIETNYIIEGEAEVWLENEEGLVEKKILTAGDYFTVLPPRKHRVIAKTDIILQEVSTPEVDDVVRLEDDANRKDGKIDHEHERMVLCILAAGMGRRLENLSTFINKGLLPLDNKAIISHIIDKTPTECEIIVALGYKGDMVQEYCEAAHPQRKFTFVDVGDYAGEHASPAYSINCCREYLQRPFYLVTADTIIEEELPPLNGNWLGLHPTSIPELYSTAAMKDGVLTSFKNKDKEGHEYAFIGLASIYDYTTFWNELKLESKELVSAFYELDKYSHFKGKVFEWYDVGTIENYLKAKKHFEKGTVYSIPKINGEFLYKKGTTFIKLFSDGDTSAQRIARNACLNGWAPSLTFKGKYLYAYEWIPGETLYKTEDLNIWRAFLEFAQNNLWVSTSYEVESVRKLCSRFYKEKTLKRLSMFLASRTSDYEGEHNVNEMPTRSIHELLAKFDWESVLDGTPTQHFHGDLQFDNILYGTDGNFYLLDWRHNFGGSVEVGDVYYDLAKLYGGLVFSYNLLKDESNYTIETEGISVRYSYSHNLLLDTFRKEYEAWIFKHHYDLQKVKRLTALIFLNMAPLHERELGDLLFYKAKCLLEDLDDK